MNHACKPHRETLARGPMCAVDRCRCGVLHVSFGPVTLRLEPGAVASLNATLAEALRALEGGATTAPSAATGDGVADAWARRRRDSLPS